MSKRLHVYLGHFHSTFGKNLRVTVPLGMSYAAAYLNKRFGDDVVVRQLTTTGQLDEALRDEVPSVFACGAYSWNASMTSAVARCLKRRHPDLVVALAGPSVPTEPTGAEAGLRRSPHIDFFIPQEGERPIANLVEACLGAADPKDVIGSVVDGCYSLSPDTLALQGAPLGRHDDLEEIPSPYLTGLCDPYLLDPDYIPLIQTSRGCPYRCTFCVAGHDWWSKLRAFDVERVRQEIDYIRVRSSNPLLRIADENFGIMPRDVEIAEHIRRTKDDHGYPSLVHVYTDKHLTKNIKKVVVLMRDLIPLNISFQSLSKDVLKNIKRINIRDGMIDEAVAFGREHELVLSTELIFALPGETIESFLDSVNTVLDFRFDNVVIYTLNVLDQAEMAFEEYRARFGLKTKFSLSDNGYSEYDSERSFEVDELVVETSTIPEDQYLEFFKFVFFFNFALFYGWLRELVYLFECNGVRATSIIRSMLENPADYPTVAEFSQRYLDGQRAMLVDTREEIVELVSGIISRRPEQITDHHFGTMRQQYTVFTDLFMEERFEDVIREFSTAGSRLYAERLGGPPPASFREQLALVAEMEARSFIPLHRRVPAEIVFESRYDLVRWSQANFKVKLEDVELDAPRRFKLTIGGYDYYEDIWASSTDDVHRMYLLNFASSNPNRRRHLAYAP